MQFCPDRAPWVQNHRPTRCYWLQETPCGTSIFRLDPRKMVCVASEWTTVTGCLRVDNHDQQWECRSATGWVWVSEWICPPGSPGSRIDERNPRSPNAAWQEQPGRRGRHKTRAAYGSPSDSRHTPLPRAAVRERVSRMPCCSRAVSSGHEVLQNQLWPVGYGIAGAQQRKVSVAITIGRLGEVEHVL